MGGFEVEDIFALYVFLCYSSIVGEREVFPARAGVDLLEKQPSSEVFMD
jgi:hypothetical protein